MKIAIIGAGIGGMTLALALRRRGMQATIYERSAALTEIGAAVALSANATRELERLGLLPALHVLSTEPSELIFRDGHSGERVASHPVRQDERYRARFGGPYYGVHRADLQRVLGAAVGGTGLRLDHQLTALMPEGAGMRLTFANGFVDHVDLVIGADGVRSAVRRYITGGAGTRYSGTSAFRGIVPVTALPSLPDPQAIQFWMGEGDHLLHYAIGENGQDVNFFAVVEGPREWPDPDRWTTGLRPGEAVKAFAGWHPAVTEMVGASTFTSRWGLFVVPPLRHWHRGPAVLLGDAAHAMLPHHGQGANTTIEDAVTLAALLPEHPGALESRLVEYAGLRRSRTRMIQHSAWVTNTALHVPDGAARDRRDQRMRAFPDDFGWIHGFDASGTAKSLLQRLRTDARLAVVTLTGPQAERDLGPVERPVCGRLGD